MDTASTVWQSLTCRRRRCAPAKEFWALKDVSLDVQPGEVVGIIGRNGAGKSTLLKILSRIVEPTSGRVTLRGRVGSLLEVGTGFHPELTGRENVYLNGSILGMSRKEIDRKFEEIVAFADVEQFLDTPVKRYSSGMYVRLAFAVAAHLEPEILIVDEVLAVGDTAFQSKCVRKMREVGSHGRTVFFVSHNLGSLQQLCSRGLVLRTGAIVADLPISDAVGSYLRGVKESAVQDLDRRTDRIGSGLVRLQAIRIAMDYQDAPGLLATGRPAEFSFHLSEPRGGVDLSFTIFDDLGTPISNFDTHRSGPLDSVSQSATNRFVCRIDPLPLLPGHYRINAMLRVNRAIADHIEGAALFEVQEGLIEGRRPGDTQTWGKVHVPHTWIAQQRSCAFSDCG
jgi:lipopolysaccharide transport system ATP-binding protein